MTFIPAKAEIDRAVLAICAEQRADQMCATAYFVQRIEEESVAAEHVLEAMKVYIGYALQRIANRR